jgi:hypothetical protein
MEAINLVDKDVKVLTATIAVDGTTSNAVLLYGATAIAITTPAAMVGTAFSFLGSVDGGLTFVAIRDSLNNLISYTFTANSGYPLEPRIFAGYDQIKVVSNDTETSAISFQIKPFAI